MSSRTADLKTERKSEGNEKYVHDVFELVRKVESLSVVDKDTRFNSTELRLIGEVLAAKYAGKRLISTQLAKLLGVTRSAISQIVNRLEKEGVVARVSDDVDKKIAYIEITDEILETYSEDLAACVDFVGKVVAKFGVERFNQMCALVDAFCETVWVESAALEDAHKCEKNAL